MTLRGLSKALGLMACLVPTAAAAQTPTPQTPAQPSPAVEAPPAAATAAPEAGAAAAPNPYCEAIADAAAEARFAWQTKTLETMRLEIEERAAMLEQKRAETEAWLKRRQDFLDRTEDRLVSIYSQMRPDAAAAQIAAMQDDAAVALLTKIDTRRASGIMNEMEPGRAAHLSNVITGVLKRAAAANRARTP